MKNKLILICLLVLATCMYSALADFTINGTTYDLNGNALNATNITVIVKDSDFATQLASNTTLSGENGWFELNVSEGAIYLTSIVHRNNDTNEVDYVGQSLPPLPHAEFSAFTNISFYLYEGATINVTALNSTGDVLDDTDFAVQIKDKKLGYPVTCYDTVNNDNDSICHVPKDRNYSIMVYPASGSQHNFVPVSFDWSNFSQTDDETFGLSSYNGTLLMLHKQFNVTESFARVTGFVNYSGIDAWNTLTIVPFVFDPGDMVFMSAGTLPYNTSAWNLGGSDFYNLSSGFYNISLPYAEQETVKYLLFAAARNTTAGTTTNYGAYYNLTVTGDTEINFTLYGLLGDDSFINMSDGGTGGEHLANTSQLSFQFTNSSGNLANVAGHVEVIVDYSAYNCSEFTFMEDLSGANDGSFDLPLLNVTGVKEINVYSNNYAPKRVPTKTAAQLTASSEINLTTFNPGDISGTLAQSSINMNLYRSNATCDVPAPPTKCLLTPSSTLDAMNMFKVVLGGGKMSFRMGLTTTGIEIHYVNVDMLASGPPDGLFDSSTSETASDDSFSSALTFGSQGPTIYDYVLISMPYTEGSTSQSGLNEEDDINISIPTFYDEDWNTIWDTTNNGTNGTALGANFSHYNTKRSEWETLMSPTNCSTNVSWLNTSNPCYLDTTNNKIWVRLPHFSGTEPTITGDGITAAATTSSSTSSSSSSSSGGGGAAETQVSGQFAKTVWSSITAGETTTMEVANGEIGVTSVEFDVSKDTYGAWLKVAKTESLPSHIGSFDKTTYKYFEITKNIAFKDESLGSTKISFKVQKSWLEENGLTAGEVALYRYNEDMWSELTTTVGEDDDTYVHFTAETPGFSFFAIGERTSAVPVVEAEEPGVEEVGEEAEPEAAAEEPAVEEKGAPAWPWIVTGIIVLVIIAMFVWLKKRK